MSGRFVKNELLTTSYKVHLLRCACAFMFVFPKLLLYTERVYSPLDTYTSEQACWLVNNLTPCWIMPMDIMLEVLKWVLVILIAGFIGQFGKSLSLHVIDYYRKKKEKSTPPAPTMTEEAGKAVFLSSADKEDQKEAGIRVVREDDATTETESIMGAQEQNAKAVKKALKAQVKAKKKAKN